MPNARSVSKRKATPRTAPEKPATIKQPLFLTGIQERIADIFGELIVMGGTRRNLEALCRIAADHEARRLYVPLMEGKSAFELERSVSERAADRAREWYDDLAAARSNYPRLPETIRPEPKTVTDLILSKTRVEVKDYFEGFLNGAMPAELAFMWQVMTTWESIHNPHNATGFEAFHIANAFEDQIRRKREYVRVPTHLVDDVERYTQALLKARPEAA